MMIHKCCWIRFTGRKIKKSSAKKTVIRPLHQFYMKDAIKAARKRQVNPLRELSLKNRRMFITILNTRRLLMPPENQHVYCETQISKTKCIEICKLNNPAESGGFNTPQRAFEFVSKARFVVSYP